MPKRRFESSEDGANKFWEIERVGSDLAIAWGKIGTKGQSQTKSFASEAKADEALAKLVREKTGKGYVETAGTSAPASAAPMPSRGTTLVYTIADFDAEDECTFVVSETGDSIAVTAAGATTEHALDASAAESAPGIWVLAQGERMPKDAWCPPFLVPRALHAMLVSDDASGSIRTGYAPERDVLLTRCEKDELSEEGSEAISGWKGELVTAKSDEGDEIAFADDAGRPQLVWYRTDDVCTIAWSSGVLPSSGKKPAKKPEAKPGKRRSAAETLRDESAPRPDRIRAAKSLAKSATNEALDVLAAAMIEADRQLAAQVSSAFASAYHQRARAGDRYDALPALRALIERTPDAPTDPTERHAYDHGPYGGAVAVMLSTIQGAIDAPGMHEAFALAASRPIGINQTSALAILANRGDPDAIDRASQMLAAPMMSTSAALALYALPPEVAIPRVLPQFEGRSDVDKSTMATALINYAEGRATSAWLDVLEKVSAFAPYAAGAFQRWVTTNASKPR